MNRLKGILMIIIGSMFWGATGPMMEWLLSETGLSASFMLAVRLIIAGTLMLIFIHFTGKMFFLYGSKRYGGINYYYLVSLEC